MSLANKYRPQTFDAIIGQEHITEILKAQMQSSKQTHHNYLLFGPRGTGKTTAARIIAKAINCTNSPDGNPCNICDNCRTINEGKTLDYVEIDAASHTGVDNIREEILDKALYPPTALKKKIYVIDEVHMLSKGAFNALLKTIEEPKANVCFILATTEIHKVPETIISRCQVFNFKKVSEPDMAQHLERICKEEALKYSQEALHVIAKISEGCVRDAVKYVDQVSILGDISEEHITKFLGVAPESMIANFLEMMRAGDEKTIFTQVDTIHEQGVDLYNFAKQTLMYIDQHFIEDIPFFAKTSEAFTEIISGIRYYPYPTIVYKIALHKHMDEMNNDNGKEINTVKIPATPTENPQTPPKQILWNPQTQSSEIPVTPTPAPIAPAIPEASPAVVPPTPPSTPPPADTQDYTKLLEQVVDRLEAGSFKDNLQHQIAIEEITETRIKIIVINKVAEMMLKKPENITNIEKIFAEILGKDMVIEIKFENKEAYFARKLG